MNSFYYEKELRQLRGLFEAASEMTDEQIQQAYNCDDTKEEFLDYTQEEIDRYQELYDEAVEEEEGVSWDGLDPAFRCWKDVYAMFV